MSREIAASSSDNGWVLDDDDDNLVKVFEESLAELRKERESGTKSASSVAALQWSQELPGEDRKYLEQGIATVTQRLHQGVAAICMDNREKCADDIRSFLLRIPTHPGRDALFMDCYIELMTLNNKTRDRLSREEQLGNQGLSSSASFSAELSWEDSCIDLQSWENSYIDLRREHYEIRAELFKLHRLKEKTNDAIWVGDPWSTSIVANSGMESVQRSLMNRLQPRTWLNDEIVNYFYLMLAKRDEKLCSKTYKLRSHFFKSFFIANLLNEGSATNDGEYEYQNVKRWSKKAPGKDIFDLDKILLPINTGKMHWISAVIFMQQKRIEIFDSLPSLGSNGQHYVEALFWYLQDEHLDKKKTPLPDIKEWKLVPTKRETPRQHNGDDCGVFTCIIADLLSIDLPLTFDQSHINQVREYIALSIIRGQATSFVTDASSLLRESTTFADSTLAGCDDVPFPRDAEARVGPLVGYHYQTPALPGYLSLSLPGYPSLAAANDVAAATAATSTAPTTVPVPGPALRRSTRSASLAATAAITGDKTAVAANEPIEIIDDYIPDDEMPSSVFMAHLIEKIAKRTNVLYNDIENLIDDKGVTTSIWDGIKKLLTAKKKYDEMCYGCILNNLEEMYDASAATVATIDTVTATTVKQRTSTGSGDDEEEQYIRMNRDYLTFKLAVSVIKGSTSLNISDVTGDNVLKAFVTRSNLIPKQEDARGIFMYTIQGGRKYTSQDFRGLPLKDILIRRDVRTTIITLTIEDKADSSGGAKSKASKAGVDSNSESIHDQQQGRTGQKTGLVKKLDGDLGDYWNTNSDTKKKETTAEKKKKKKKRKRTSSTASVAANNHQRRHSRAATQGKKQYSDHNDDDDDDNDGADTARPKKKQRIHKQVYLDAVYRYLKYPKPRPLQIDFLRSEASGQILSGENKCKMSFSRYLGLIVAAIKIQTLALVAISIVKHF